MTKKSRRSKQRIRSNARRKYFNILLDKQENKCAACGGLMNRIKNDPFQATIEHKKRIADGGGNYFDNLELLHLKCNAARDKRLKKNGLICPNGHLLNGGYCEKCDKQYPLKLCLCGCFHRRIKEQCKRCERKAYLQNKKENMPEKRIPEWCFWVMLLLTLYGVLAGGVAGAFWCKIQILENKLKETKQVNKD